MMQMYQNDSSLPRQIIYENIPVVTTELLAQILGISNKAISENFKAYAGRYQSGIHYYLLKGKELKNFIFRTPYVGLFDISITSLRLWTERGCCALIDSLASVENYEALKSRIVEYFKVGKVIHNFLPKESYTKQEGSIALSTPKKDLEITVINGTVHALGGSFNINNALLCYKGIRQILFAHAGLDIEMVKDLEMLSILNPDYADTIELLNRMYNIYNSTIDASSGQITFYEFSEN